MEYLCPKCSTKMTECRASSFMGKFSAIKFPIKYLTTKESSELIPYVCSNCGHVEWYVEKPDNFK